MEGNIDAVCVSTKKGTRKVSVGKGELLPNHGLAGDVHAGPGNRQISLLSTEVLAREPFRSAGLQPGDFAENFTVSGIDVAKLPIGTLLAIGESAVLQVTQIGKKCHTGCDIMTQVGTCVMPKEGAFARVLRGGPVIAGDCVEVIKPEISVGVLTASDKGSRGERIDLSGPTIEKMVTAIGGRVIWYRIVPDEQLEIQAALLDAVDCGVEIVFTTGGTGLTPRDVTPDATLSVIDKVVPGLAEIMRMKSYAITPRAMLSRAVAGVKNQTLIINLPGSVKGVSECLGWIIDVIPHAVQLMKGEGADCGIALGAKGK